MATLALYALGAFRGFVVNERRVVFEVLIPATVFCLMQPRSWPAGVKWVLAWLPLIAPLLLAAIFLPTEYFRSWSNFYSDGRSGSSFLEFGLTRLAGYYVTALNNGVVLLHAGAHTHGFATFGGILKMPLVGVADAEALRNGYAAELERLTNPEFNNIGGSIAPVLDFGMAGGTALLASFGLAAGFTYAMSRRGSLLSALLYPFFFFALLESTRIWQIATSFSVLNILFLLLFSATFYVGRLAKAG